MARARKQPAHVPNGGNVRNTNSAHRTTQNHRFGAAIAEVKDPRIYRRQNNPFRRNNQSSVQWQPLQASNNSSPRMPIHYVQQYTSQYAATYQPPHPMPYSYHGPSIHVTYNYYPSMVNISSNDVPRNYHHNSIRVTKANWPKPAPSQNNAHGRKRDADNRQPSECAICLDKPVNSVLYGCGHMSMCYDCAVKQWRDTAGGRCPICRTAIRDVIRVYKS